MNNKLRRFAGYLISICFIGIGFSIWNSDGFSLIVPILLVIGSFYILMDLYVMITKGKKNDGQD